MDSRRARASAGRPRSARDPSTYGVEGVSNGEPKSARRASGAGSSDRSSARESISGTTTSTTKNVRQTTV
jgi:hypothetical protein